MLLEQVARRPDNAIDDFDLGLPAHRSLLPDPSARLEASPQPSIPALLDEIDDGDAPALRHCGRVWTRGELDGAAAKIAASLAANGLGANKRIAVVGFRGVGFVAAMIGVLRAGAVLVPLDSRLSGERIRRMLEAVPLDGWLGIGDVALPSGTAAVAIQVDRNGEVAMPAAIEGLARVEAVQQAYIYFTSGTRATPRAIVGVHGAWSHFLRWQRETFSIGRDDRCAQLTGVSFDVALREIFLPLVSGATLCIPDNPDDLSAATIIPWLAEEKITVLHLTPTVARHWLAQLDAPVRLPRLRYVFFAGEPLTAELVDRWHALLPSDAQIVNLYGPTETTLAKCAYLVPRANRREGVQPIGAAIPGAQALLFNPGGLQCRGVAELGEIVLRTPFRTAGLVNDGPNIFIPNPYGADPADALYRTGDLGRFNEDGLLEILGRLDRQVKVNGVRLQPDEVERILELHPSLRAAAVAALPWENAFRLVALVVADGAVSEGELRDHARQHLPAALVLSVIRFVDRLPMTANGKLDLRELDSLCSIVSEPPAPEQPRTELEERLAAVWRSALRRDVVGTNQEFFQLGGHSLLAAELVHRIKRELGIELRLLDLMEHPTIATLAAAIGKAGVKPAIGKALCLDADRDRRPHEPFPLTDVQEAYVLGRSSALELGNVATHSYAEFEVDALDLNRFERAVHDLIMRHDMLRAVVRADGTQQVLAEIGAAPLKRMDLRGESTESAAMQLTELRQRLSHEVRPLHRWPLFEIVVCCMPGNKWRVHISIDALICDAWSRRVLAHDLLCLYRGEADKLQPLTLTFRDVVLAERTLRGQAGYGRAERYWFDRLVALPPPPPLPRAQAAPADQQARFRRLQTRIEPGIWSVLKQFAARAGITPSGAVAAVYSDICAAWSGTPHFLLSVTLFNRPPIDPQVDLIVGDFTSIVLLETPAERLPTFRARARALQAQLWSDLDHSACSGVKVLRELNRRKRGMRTVPVVLTCVLFDDRGQAGASEWQDSQNYGISQTPQVLLDCGVLEHRGALVVRWDYVEGAFPAGMIEDMFGAYVEMLSQLGGSEARWVEQAAGGALPSWQGALFDRVNATGVEEAPRRLEAVVWDRIVEQPEAVAVVDGERSVSYGALGGAALVIEEELRRRGVGRGDVVGLVTQGGWEAIAGALGIPGSGAAYVAIDAEWPQARRDSLLSGARAVVTTAELAGRLSWPAQMHRVVVSADALSPRSLERRECGGSAAEVAYVMYTSGSTGRPKGVTMTHAAVWNTVGWMNRWRRVNRDDAVLALSSMSFDLSVYDVFGLLGAGGRVVVAGSRRDPSVWLERMHRHQVTMWNAVPALAEMLVSYAEGRGADLPGSLRQIWLSGDWVRPGLVRRLKQRSAAAVVALGGATEAAIWSIAHEVGEIEPGLVSIPYGKPLANQEFHVLTGAMERCPVWVSGELYIGGRGLALGYAGSATETAERFVPDPRGGGKRLYATGDLGRYRPDGTIEFLGRADRQVKVGGHRIELKEIEAALLSHPDIAEAAVAAPETPDGRRLVAAIVAKSTLGTDDVRRHLGALLPDYMVPRSCAFLSELPLTPNGKVDISKLAVADEPALSAIAPLSPLGELVRAIWIDVLGLSHADSNCDFFEAGGDSLRAIRLVERLVQSCAVEISLQSLFDRPKLGALIEAVEYARSHVPESGAEPRRKGEEFPLTAAQRAMWVLMARNPASASALQIPTQFWLRGQLDKDAIGRALDTIISRHEALRTAILVRAGAPVQVARDEVKCEMAFIDAKGLTAAEVESVSHQEVARPLDLSQAPPLRVSIISRDHDEHLLVIVAHHILLDAISIDILLSELAGIIAAGQNDGYPLTLRNERPFSDTAWREHALTPVARTRMCELLRAQLGDSGPVDMPYAKPRSSGALRDPGRVRFRWASDLAVGLTQMARRERVTLYMVLLAVIGCVVRGHSGQSDFVVASSVSTRRDEESATIGLLLNTALLRIRTGDGSFKSSIANARNALLGAYDVAQVSVEELLSANDVAGTAAEALLTRFIVGFRVDRPARLDLPGISVEVVAAECRSVKADFEIQFLADETGLGGLIDFDRAVYDESAVMDVAAAIERLARHVVQDASMDVADMARLALSSQRNRRPVRFQARVPRAVRLSKSELVGITTPRSAGDPVLVAPRIDGVALGSWLAAEFATVDALIRTHGAIKFRGFGKIDAERLERIVGACKEELLPDEEQTSPRRHLGKAIYTSTEYSQARAIPMHNENSYAARWPLRLWFACVTPAEQGGATPLADSARVYQQIDPEVRSEFERKRVTYVRNFDPHLSLSWQQAFGTEMRDDVESYCRQRRIATEWLTDGRLRTRQTRDATVAHPITAAMLWFNQAHLFHASAHAEDLSAALTRVFSEQDLPRHACFGDGTSIDPAALQHIRSVYDSVKVEEPWQAGDIVYLDNMRIAHGRQPFVGERLTIVAMTGRLQPG
ncbi:amino acid adenylation domain-containing protein [Bradyrhizobium japonicum]